MLAPFEIRQHRFERRFQRFEPLVSAISVIGIEGEVAQVRRADIVSGVARRIGVCLGKGAVQRVRCRVSVQYEYAFRLHGG